VASGYRKSAYLMKGMTLALCSVYNRKPNGGPLYSVPLSGLNEAPTCRCITFLYGPSVLRLCGAVLRAAQTTFVSFLSFLNLYSCILKMKIIFNKRDRTRKKHDVLFSYSYFGAFLRCQVAPLVINNIRNNLPQTKYKSVPVVRHPLMQNSLLYLTTLSLQYRLCYVEWAVDYERFIWYYGCGLL
jgi:hypothetical protein